MILYVTHPKYLDHISVPGLPEHADRLAAVAAGVDAAGIDVSAVEPRPATIDELARVHDHHFITDLAEFVAAGGGEIDDLTLAGPGSWDAAVLAAGAGLEAVERLLRGDAHAAFCAVRPPGHHARRQQAMGLCLLNNAAVTAAALADQRQRVLIIDWDAHHGNGTQEAFYARAEVGYVSLHQYPLYPGTGGIADTGAGDGAGMTVNVPLPRRATGDVYRAAIDMIVLPFAEWFQPDWLVVSAGFDGHRADPTAGLRLTSGDFADMTLRVLPLVPAGRRIVLLEGGYNLTSLTACATACLAGMAGEELRPEPVSTSGPGMDVVTTVAARVRDLCSGPGPAMERSR